MYPIIVHSKEIEDVAQNISSELRYMVCAVFNALKALEENEIHNPAKIKFKKIKDLGTASIGTVTDTDIISQNAILSTISKLDPNAKFICEEKSAGHKYHILNASNFYTESLNSTVYTIDPIDGTTAKVLSLPDWTITTGCYKKGVQVAGVILNPTKNTMVFGMSHKAFAVNYGQIESFIPKDGKPHDLKSLKTAPFEVYCEGFDFQLSHYRHLEHVRYKMGDASKACLKSLSCANSLMDVLIGKVKLMVQPPQSCWDYSGLPMLYYLGGSVKFYTLENGKITIYDTFQTKFLNPGKRIAGLIVGRDKTLVEEYSKALQHKF